MPRHRPAHPDMQRPVLWDRMSASHGGTVLESATPRRLTGTGTGTVTATSVGPGVTVTVAGSWYNYRL